MRTTPTIKSIIHKEAFIGFKASGKGITEEKAIPIPTPIMNNPADSSDVMLNG